IVDSDDLAVDQDRVSGLRRGRDRRCDNGKRQQRGAAEPDSHLDPPVTFIAQRRNDRPGGHSASHSRTVMPASLMIGAHLSISARRKAPSSAGVEPATTTPSCSSRCFVAGSASAAAMSAWIFRMIAGAVLAGANKAYQDETSKPGTPAS